MASTGVGRGMYGGGVEVVVVNVFDVMVVKLVVFG